MIGIDETLMFQPLTFAVLTVSDTRDDKTDKSGNTLADRITTAGHRLKDRAIVKDEADAVSTQVRAWVSDPDIQVILTTGGTGLTGRDVTVEAVAPLFEKTLEGFSVLFHQLSAKTIGLATLQSRACAGVMDGTFIFCLPGSTGAVTQAWDDIICGALDSRYRPTSLVDLIPRLKE
jgi:molybdenum cofactor biosynthesis protein B